MEFNAEAELMCAIIHAFYDHPAHANIDKIYLVDYVHAKTGADKERISRLLEVMEEKEVLGLGYSIESMDQYPPVKISGTDHYNWCLGYNNAGEKINKGTMAKAIKKLNLFL